MAAKQNKDEATTMKEGEAALAAKTSAGRFRGGFAKIEFKVEFDLDDSSIFNLHKGGIKMTAVTEN